jgi:hypothetical protein
MVHVGELKVVDIQLVSVVSLTFLVYLDVRMSRSVVVHGNVNCAAERRPDLSFPAPCTALSRASDPVVIRFLLDAKADVNLKGCTTVLRGACAGSYAAGVGVLGGVVGDELAGMREMCGGLCLRDGHVTVDHLVVGDGLYDVL